MKDENIDNKITEKLEIEIYEKTLDIEIDYTELVIDNITENDLLKEIPIVKTLVAFYNISSSFIARHNVKKILVFLKEFHTRNIDEFKLANFKAKFVRDSIYKEQVLETVLVLNEKFIEVVQSKILANLFKAHIEEHISWVEFNQLAFALNSLNPAGYDFLHRKCKEEKWSDKDGEAFMYSCGIGHLDGLKFTITETGHKLYEFGIKPLRN
ncbi:hypothetical protein [Flavobacterium sp.]|jgi:hypothetical protein|uniref:hypothetical protein n=1 Tax=Flavobacterium sp. TaxID=239 RepID=UPI0037BE7377